MTLNDEIETVRAELLRPGDALRTGWDEFWEIVGVYRDSVKREVRVELAHGRRRIFLVGEGVEVVREPAV